MQFSFPLAAVGVIIISLIMNWGVQLAYYFWRKRENPKAFAGEKTLLNYYTGYLGDSVIVPLVNVLILYIIVKTGSRISLSLVVKLVATGLVINVLAHYLQGKLKLTNWSMPKPYQWNFAGYWHMVSFPIQMAYLVFFAWLTWANWMFLWANVETRFAIGIIYGLMALFVVLYLIDNSWLSFTRTKRA